jgi:hypothetical protein
MAQKRRRDGGFGEGGIGDGEIVEGEIEEGGCEETFLCSNLKNMSVHSATCSSSVELHKMWYTLADFLPNWDISRGFLYIFN